MCPQPGPRTLPPMVFAGDPQLDALDDLMALPPSPALAPRALALTTLDLTPDELSKVRLAVYRETCRMTRRNDPEWHALLDRLDAALADGEATT